MTCPIDRRAMLIGAGAAAVAAAGPVAAQSGIRVELTFAGGTPIPEGDLGIHLEDLVLQDGARRAARTRARSDGKRRAIVLILPRPARSAASAGLQVVARLERTDGWLLARGSAPVAARPLVQVTLDPVMYRG